MKRSERLVARLRSECGLELPEGTYARRTYAGWAQRSAGAWVWRLECDGAVVEPDVGSHWTVSQLLASERIEVHAETMPGAGRCVDPSRADQKRLFARSRTV